MSHEIRNGSFILVATLLYHGSNFADVHIDVLGALESACRPASDVPELHFISWLNTDPVIRRSSQALLATEVLLGRLDRNVTQQELDLGIVQRIFSARFVDC